MYYQQGQQQINHHQGPPMIQSQFGNYSVSPMVPFQPRMCPSVLPQPLYQREQHINIYQASSSNF